MQLTTIPTLPPLTPSVDYFARAAGTLSTLDAALSGGERRGEAAGKLWVSAITDVYDGYKFLRTTGGFTDELDDLAQQFGPDIRLTSRLLDVSERLDEHAALIVRQDVRRLHPLLQAGSDAMRAAMQATSAA